MNRPADGSATPAPRPGAGWLWNTVAAAALLVFTANYLTTRYIDNQTAWAKGLSADIEARSQQLAVQVQAAAHGERDAFAKLQATKDALAGDVRASQYGQSTHAGLADAAGVAMPLARVADAWAHVEQDAEIILRNEQFLETPAPAASPSTTQDPPDASAQDAGSPPITQASALRDTVRDLAAGTRDLQAAATGLSDTFSAVAQRRMFPSPYFALVGGGLFLLALLLGLKARR